MRNVPVLSYYSKKQVRSKKKDIYIYTVCRTINVLFEFLLAIRLQKFHDVCILIYNIYHKYRVGEEGEANCQIPQKA